jgi:hypothetical protein
LWKMSFLWHWRRTTLSNWLFSFTLACTTILLWHVKAYNFLSQECFLWYFSVLRITLFIVEARRGRARWYLDLKLSKQSVPITTVVSSNPVHDEVYSIQHYVIKFVSDLRQVGGFLWVLRFPPPIKLTATIYM